MNLENNQNSYICNEHQQLGIMLILEESFNEPRIMCEVCIKSQIKPLKMIEITIAQEQINKIKSDQISKLYLDQIAKIKQIQFYFDQLTTEIYNSLEGLKKRLISSQQEYEKKLENINQCDISIDYQLLLNQQQYEREVEQIKIQSNNKNNYESIKTQFENCLEKISNLYNQNSIQIINDLKKQSCQNVKLLQSLKQTEQCYALSFNKDCSLIAAGSNKQIIIWKQQNGKYIADKTLKGHKATVTCIAFSQHQNWLVSGEHNSYGGTLICWKQLPNGEWIKSYSTQQHKDCVTCFLLNKDENELISSGYDGECNVWKVDIQKNQIIFDYSLEQKQQNDYFFSLSLNESETTIISSSFLKIINVWCKVQEQENWKWQHKQIIEVDNFIYRLCFIQDDTFIFQQNDQQILRVCQLSNNEYIEIKNKNFNLFQNIADTLEVSKIGNLNQCQNNEDYKELMDYFQSCYNKEQKLLFYKHGTWMFFIQINEIGNFSIIKSINYGTHCCFGKLSSNGRKAVIWNNKTDDIEIFEILTQHL